MPTSLGSRPVSTQEAPTACQVLGSNRSAQLTDRKLRLTECRCRLQATWLVLDLWQLCHCQALLVVSQYHTMPDGQRPAWNAGCYPMETLQREPKWPEPHSGAEGRGGAAGGSTPALAMA